MESSTSLLKAIQVQSLSEAHFMPIRVGLIGLDAALLERATRRERVFHELHVCNLTLGIDFRPYCKGRSLGDFHHAGVLELVLPLRVECVLFKEGKRTGNEVKATRCAVRKIEASNRCNTIPAHVREASKDSNVLTGAEEAFHGKVLVLPVAAHVHKGLVDG